MAGLEDVVAVRTRLSGVDGSAGKLVIGGFPVEELAGNASFEETVYLLWNGELPDAGELAAFRKALAARRPLPGAMLDLLRSAASEQLPEMDALRMAAGAVGLGEPGGGSGDKFHEDALSLVARFPVIVASYRRLLDGAEPLEPRAELGARRELPVPSSPGRSRERSPSARWRRTSTPSWTTG